MTHHTRYRANGIDTATIGIVAVPRLLNPSPVHYPGYQFDERWAADLSFGTDLSDNVDVDAFAVNGYRYFGTGSWRPYLSAGLSSFSIDAAPDDDTQQAQAGFGLSGELNRNMELRAGYQHHFTISGDSFQDKALGTALVWHFRKPEPTTVSQAEPQPETVPEELRVQFDPAALLRLLDGFRQVGGHAP